MLVSIYVSASVRAFVCMHVFMDATIVSLYISLSFLPSFLLVQNLLSNHAQQVRVSAKCRIRLDMSTFGCVSEGFVSAAYSYRHLGITRPFLLRFPPRHVCMPPLTSSCSRVLS
jgi:hypothetical protein